jgi:sterol desaturase/sphingolipid hydroxylase (fatty acid hydroxylase superfamily)
LLDSALTPDLSTVVHGVTVLAMLALAGLELRDPVFRSHSFAPGVHRRRNWAYLVPSIIAILCVQTLAAWFRGHLPSLIPPGKLPFVVDVAACTLVAELITWVLHWIKHQHPFLWRLHFQHHREEHFNIWMVTHTHALEVALSGTAMVAVLVLLGFSPLAVQLYFAFYSIVLMYHHSCRGYSLGWLDWIITSPAYHRCHHWHGGRGNYSGALTVWDAVFGTARWPRAEGRTAPVGLPPDAPEPFGFQQEMLYFLSIGSRKRT